VRWHEISRLLLFAALGPMAQIAYPRLSHPLVEGTVIKRVCLLVGSFVSSLFRSFVTLVVISRKERHCMCYFREILTGQSQSS